MISLTTLLASATVAAAAKKVEDAPAPGIVDTILGFVPSWLGGPVAQVFDKGVETLGVVLGWATATPQVVADVVTWGADTAMSLPATARDVVTGDADTLDKLADLAVTIGSIVFVVYVVLTAINLFLSTLESVRDYLAKVGLLTLPRVPAKVFGVEIPEGVLTVVNTPIGLAQKYLVDPIKHYQHRTIIPLEGGHGSTLGGTIATMASATAACLFLAATPDLLALARGGADKSAAEAIAWTLGTALGLKYVAARA